MPIPSSIFLPDILRFATASDAALPMMQSRYDAPLVVISILVAIFASFTALSLTERITRSRGLSAMLWTACGALTLGSGIWSMHFIGMLAFRLPIPVGFDFGITLTSLALPVVVSGLALWQASRPTLPFYRLAIGALLMGGGINAMHYTGMAAMQMVPAIRYDLSLFLASVAVAILASGAAMWISHRLRNSSPHVWLPRALAAVMMGAAIVGMHYLGMAAAHFPADSVCFAATRGFTHDSLALMVIIATMALLTLTMLASIFDAKLDARSHSLALSQAAASERQALLQLEREARAEAERLSEMKDQFLATLSHELRTPLSAILGWTQLLQVKGKEPGLLEKGLVTIERNARLQAQLIEDLLDMSRIISGKIHVELKPVDLRTAALAAVETVRPTALDKHILIDTDGLAASGADAVVLGDVGRLQQVMWNLLSNAVKFTPEGGTVTVGLTSDAQTHIVTVRDTGIGIKPDFLPHVFDRFRQADASTTRRYGGLGLGLSIVKQLIELHGGTIEPVSAGEGCGTVFTVRLPSAAHRTEVTETAAAGGPAAGSPAAVSSADGAMAAVHLDGLRILVVDDQADARELVRRILSDAGATVVLAASAAEALDIAPSQGLDAIISDIGMPEMDGFTLVRRLRNHPGIGRAMPILALTAFSRAEDKTLALQAGFTSCMIKPFEPQALVTKIGSMAASTLPQTNR
jgi:signal transduction histidine kinase/ActR/RegA family two-component response regulator